MFARLNCESRLGRRERFATDTRTKGHEEMLLEALLDCVLIIKPSVCQSKGCESLICYIDVTRRLTVLTVGCEIDLGSFGTVLWYHYDVVVTTAGTRTMKITRPFHVEKD